VLALAPQKKMQALRFEGLLQKTFDRCSLQHVFLENVCCAIEKKKDMPLGHRGNPGAMAPDEWPWLNDLRTCACPATTSWRPTQKKVG